MRTRIEGIKQHLHKEYPNELLAYQRKLTDAGHADAYHHWILMNGDAPAFNDWKSANKPAWDEFVKWYGKHPIRLSAKRPMIRD